MNDTVRELGAALGIAVLGSLISAGYADGIKDVAKALPADLGHAAEGSLAAAVTAVGPAVNAGAGAPAADAFVTSATDAWMSGLSTAMIVAAGLALAAAIWTFVAMPSKAREKEFIIDPHAAEAALPLRRPDLAGAGVSAAVIGAAARPVDRGPANSPHTARSVIAEAEPIGTRGQAAEERVRRGVSNWRRQAGAVVLLSGAVGLTIAVVDHFRSGFGDRARRGIERRNPRVRMLKTRPARR
jgi:hypothetical protein